MSFSNWLHSSAGRRTVGASFGSVILGLAALFIWAFWPAPPSVTRQTIGTLQEFLSENLDAECLSLLRTPPAADPNPKQTEECADKASAQKKNHSDLEQSIRAANAAEYAAYFTYLQTCIAIIGTLLVTATLAASAGATFAALGAARGTIDAATATRDSVRLSLRAFAIAHRPRLRVRKVFATCVDGEPIKISAEVANIGDMGAAVDSVSVILQVGTKGSGSQPVVHDAASTRGTIYFIEGGRSLLLNLNMQLQYGSIPEVRWDIMNVHGEVIYRDIFMGDEFDIESKMHFKSTRRKTAFERVQHSKDEIGRMRFVIARNPDPDYDYED